MLPVVLTLPGTVRPHRRLTSVPVTAWRSVLSQPLVTKDMADVRYVDVFSGSHLRAHYAQDPNVNVQDIPDIDFVLSTPDGVRPLSEAVAAAAPFAWVVASHVIEHVPDLISWLAQISQIIEEDAALLLVVPDRRFSFDILRPATTVGQLLQAHELREVRPSVRAVYDHFRSQSSWTQVMHGEGWCPPVSRGCTTSRRR